MSEEQILDLGKMTRKDLEEYLVDLLRDVGQLEQWVKDLHAGMYINCVYCGHRYGPDDEVAATMADALKEHVEQCPKHPMSKLKTQNEKLKEVVRFYKSVIQSGEPWTDTCERVYEEAMEK